MPDIEHGTLVSWKEGRARVKGIALAKPVNGKVVVAGFFGRKKGTCRHQTVPRGVVSRRGTGPKDQQLFAYAAKWDDIQAAEASAGAARAARKAAREAAKVQDELLVGARMLEAFGFDVEKLEQFNRARRARGARWDQYIDDLVVTTKPDALLRSVAQYLDATGLELTASIGKDGVVLHRNRFIVTVICATHARFWRGRNVRGNFLRDGAHWEVVHERVITKFSKLRTSDESWSPADKSAKLLIEMPATVSHEVRKAAIAASTRLRTERTLAFGHPVLLSAPGYRLRFEPITTRGRAVELPYSFQRDGGTAVNVALRLKAPNDPMAIRYTDGTDPNELVSAWAAGLAGFAELTCVVAPSQTVERPALETRPERGALETLPLADLTVLDTDGYPLCVPVAPGALEGDEVPLQIGAGAPELPAGPACLTVHGHDKRFTTQENHTLMGTVVDGAGGSRLHVDRALADWSLTGNRLQIAVGFLRKGRRLAPRLKTEAARRGQPVPTINLP